MKITRLQAENVMRLKAVDVEFDPNQSLVVVRGRNRQGKSSFMNCVDFAFGGAARSSKRRVIRDGETDAWTKITTDNGYEIERRWDNDKTKLIVKDTTGKTHASAQSLINGWLSEFAFDPVAFLGESPARQREILLELCGQRDILDALETDRAEVYQQRRDINREIKRMEGAHADYAGVDESDADLEVPDVVELTKRIEDAENDARTKSQLEKEAAAHNDVMGQTETLIRELEDRLAKAREDHKQHMERRDDCAARAQQIMVVDTAPMREELASLEATRQRVAMANRKKELADTIKNLRLESDAHTETLADIENQKIEAIESAALPVSGLSFDTDGVTFNGLPLSEASTSEQIRIGMSIAMKLHPELKVVIIRQGNDLDEDAQAEVARIAAEEGYQVLMECVGKDGPATVVIEDGEVVEPETVTA